MSASISEVRLIPVRRRDGEIVVYTGVDADRADEINQHRWCLHGRGYVIRGRRRNGKSEIVFLHRQIMGVEPGERRYVDHINGNKYDNRRVNLRFVTYAENNQNVPARRGGTSRFRGVSWSKLHRKWVAQATVGGVTHPLGLFDVEEEAAHAAAEFRRQNMPFSAADIERDTSADIAVLPLAEFLELYAWKEQRGAQS